MKRASHKTMKISVCDRGKVLYNVR